jgi:hypothetical protein
MNDVNAQSKFKGRAEVNHCKGSPPAVGAKEIVFLESNAIPVPYVLSFFPTFFSTESIFCVSLPLVPFRISNFIVE